MTDQEQKDLAHQLAKELRQKFSEIMEKHFSSDADNIGITSQQIECVMNAILYFAGATNADLFKKVAPHLENEYSISTAASGELPLSIAMAQGFQYIKTFKRVYDDLPENHDMAQH